MCGLGEDIRDCVEVGVGNEEDYGWGGVEDDVGGLGWGVWESIVVDRGRELKKVG